MFRELIPIVALSIALVAAYFVFPAVWVKIAVWLFILFYVSLLIKYTRLFIITYRECLHKLDNFFSGTEAEHLRWVNFSFYAALSIGLLALAVSLFPAIHFGIVCSAIYLLFYLYFAIRIIKYGFVYEKLEKALSDNDIQPELPKEDKNTPQTPTVKSIENNLKKWLDEQQYLQSAITLDDVSCYVGTNNKYLSLYINQKMNCTFREWINRLRIEEAKRLLLDYPDINISEIALLTGFATPSHFSQQFRAITRSSPSNWRLHHKSSS